MLRSACIRAAPFSSGRAAFLSQCNSDVTYPTTFGDPADDISVWGVWMGCMCVWGVWCVCVCVHEVREILCKRCIGYKMFCMKEGMNSSWHWTVIIQKEMESGWLGGWVVGWVNVEGIEPKLP